MATSQVREIDVDALVVLLGVLIPTASSTKHAIKLLAGPDLEDAQDRERLSAAITDIMLSGLLPRE